MRLSKKKRVPAKPVKAVTAVAPPRLPIAMPLELRRAVQTVLRKIELSTPALREAGAFEILGLMAQAGHALKLTAEHAQALEQAIGLSAPPPAAAAAPPNGVHK
jgi:hypothetical protein